MYSREGARDLWVTCQESLRWYREHHRDQPQCALPGLPSPPASHQQNRNVAVRRRWPQQAGGCRPGHACALAVPRSGGSQGWAFAMGLDSALTLAVLQVCRTQPSSAHLGSPGDVLNHQRVPSRGEFKKEKEGVGEREGDGPGQAQLRGLVLSRRSSGHTAGHLKWPLSTALC